MLIRGNKKAFIYSIFQPIVSKKRFSGVILARSFSRCYYCCLGPDVSDYVTVLTYQLVSLKSKASTGHVKFHISHFPVSLRTRISTSPIQERSLETSANCSRDKDVYYSKRSGLTVPPLPSSF